MSGLPPPVETLVVPVLGWYNVKSGGIQASQMLSVPNNSYFSSPDGLNPGFVGTADGAMVHLAGNITTNDGGQNWVMWVASSLAAPDGVTIFNPNPSAGTPGRWIVQLNPFPSSIRVIVSGTIVQLSPNVELVSIRKTPVGIVTILLPPLATALLGFPVTIVDSLAVSTTYPITVSTPDNTPFSNGTGPLSDLINNNGAARSYQTDGFSWLRS